MVGTVTIGNTVTSIWKWPLELTDRQEMMMPVGARVITAQIQAGKVTIWAEVNEQAKRRSRAFWIIGTGNPFPQEVALVYIASVQMPPFMWHVYEEVP